MQAAHRGVGTYIGWTISLLVFMARTGKIRRGNLLLALVEGKKRDEKRSVLRPLNVERYQHER